MSVSIRDVAEQAGVSLATVSKVLNNRTGSRIAADTQKRVRDTATLLAYQPNRFARAMGGKQSHTLAMLVSGLQNPFYRSILEECEKRTQAAGYQAILDTAPSIDGTYKTHGKLRGWPVDGALIWAGADQKLSQFLGAQAIQPPVVYMGYPRTDDTDWVAFNLHQGGQLATEYLISRGHKRIGFVFPWSWPRESVNPNHQACLDVCRQAEVRVETITTVREEETQRVGLDTGLAIAAQPKSERPTALFCHNDVIAIGLYHGLRRGGLRVPEDIAIIGFDGIEEGQCLDIPLTTIQSPVGVFSDYAVSILTSRMNGTGSEHAQQIIIPTRLIIGGTA